MTVGPRVWTWIPGLWRSRLLTAPLGRPRLAEPLWVLPSQWNPVLFPPTNALKGQQHVYSSPAVLAQVMAQDLPEVGGRVTMDRGRNAREEDVGCFRAFNLLVSGFGTPLPYQLPVKLCS